MAGSRKPDFESNLTITVSLKGHEPFTVDCVVDPGNFTSSPVNLQKIVFEPAAHAITNHFKTQDVKRYALPSSPPAHGIS